MSNGTTTGEVQSFNIGNLDLSGISDSDLTSAERVKFLIEPGKYTLEIIDHKLFSDTARKDGAGKLWGSVLITAKDVESGRIIKDFISVPLETLVYTSKSGNQSNVKTKIFCNLMSAVTGQQVVVSAIPGLVANLGDVLKAGTLFQATTGYKRDHVSFVGENDAGDALYAIKLVDGTELVDTNGAAMRFTSRDAATEYYTQLKGFAPARGMNLISFMAAGIAHQQFYATLDC